MKKIFLIICLVAFMTSLTKGQDYKKIKNNFLLGRVEDAKTELDKLLNDPKSKAQGKKESYFWAAKINATLYKDEKTREKFPTAFKDAETALEKYAELDPEYTLVKTEGADPYFDLYSTSFGVAVKQFEAKKWSEAGNSFESAIKYIDLIIKNKWTESNISFDTASVLYAAYSWQNAKQIDKALTFYSRLADNKVADETYKDVYRFLVEEYTQEKNEALFTKYLQLGKEVFPDFQWDEYEIDFMDANFDLAKKTSVYDKEDAAGTLSEIKYLKFADLFADVRVRERDNLDSAQIELYNTKAVDAYKKAFAKNDNNAIAAFNIGVIYYNRYGELEERYNANIQQMQDINSKNKITEKDPKKKAAAEAKLKEQTDPFRNANIAIEKRIFDNIDQSAEWLEKTYMLLKDKTDRSNTEKSVISKSIDWLAVMFEYRRNKARGKDEKAFEAFEAKFKQYDALHGKF